MDIDLRSFRDTAELIAFVRAKLGMTQSALGAATRKSVGTISCYERGERKPQAIFWHDIIDAAPECGLVFNDIADEFGYRRIDSINPSGYESIHHFFVGVRVMGDLTRTGFAGALDLSARQITEIEHRAKPHPNIVRLVADRFLKPKYCYVDVVRRFRTLRPSSADLELRKRFRLLRDPATPAEQRDALRTALISDHIELAQKQAQRIARRSPATCRDAEGAWSIALVKAVDGHHRQYGDFIPYLRKCVFGQVKSYVMREWQSGTANVLRGRISAYCEAQDHLRQELQREPTTREVASHLDLPVRKVTDIRQAIAARRTKSLETNSHPVAIPSSTSAISEQTLILLAKLDPSLRTVVELRFLEGFDTGEIAERLGIDRKTAENRLNLALQQLRQPGEAA